MNNVKKREQSRLKRKKSVRKKVLGTDARPRLCIYRSLRYTYAQIISDESGKVLASASTRELKTEDASTSSVAGAKALGAKIAEVAKANKIEKVVFDRNGFLYHGRIAAVADGAREAGLEF